MASSNDRTHDTSLLFTSRNNHNNGIDPSLLTSNIIQTIVQNAEFGEGHEKTVAGHDNRLESVEECVEASEADVVEHVVHIQIEQDGPDRQPTTDGMTQLFVC